MKKPSHYKNVGVVILVLLSIAFIYQLKAMFLGVVILGGVLFSFEKLAILFSKYWMAFGKRLGDINSRIILTVFFLLILTPMAILKRIFQKKDKELSKTTWIDVEEKIDFTKPW